MNYFDEYDDSPAVRFHMWLSRTLWTLVCVIGAVAVIGLFTTILMASWDAQIAGGWFK